MNRDDTLEDAGLKLLTEMPDEELVDRLQDALKRRPDAETTTRIRRQHLDNIGKVLDSRGEAWARTDELELCHVSMKPISIPISQLPVTLGGGSDDSHRVDFAGVSRGHCRIERNGLLLTVVDLGSTNGICVNGREVQTANLCTGDWLRLGAEGFEVRRG